MPAEAQLEAIARPVPQKWRWWKSRPVLLVSIGIHLLFGVGAAYVVVSHYSTGRKLTFNAGPKSPNPAERALQHRVQMREKTKTAPAAVPKRVLSTGAAKVTLPPLPSVPSPNQVPVPMMAAAGGAGFGSKGGAGSAGGTGTGPPINFFGIKDSSTSIVIMVDVSDSMFGRTGDYDYESRKLLKKGKEQSFQTVRDEAIKLVQSLSPAVQFGIVRWSGGAYSWKPELVPATDENKAAAIEHIQTKLDLHTAGPNKGRPGGTRHDYALEEALSLKPEVIYMITDGNATASGGSGNRPEPIPTQQILDVVNTAKKTTNKSPRIHVIYYLTGKEKPEEEQMLRSLAATNPKGSFAKVQAKGRQN